MEEQNHESASYTKTSVLSRLPYTPSFFLIENSASDDES